MGRLAETRFNLFAFVHVETLPELTAHVMPRLKIRVTYYPVDLMSEHN
jgi:hypothetical protein